MIEKQMEQLLWEFSVELLFIVDGKGIIQKVNNYVIKELGFSEDAYCLKTPGGYSFGDSGVMCTARDLLIFARFVMNKGNVGGKQYMSRAYLEEATKKQVSNANTTSVTYGTYG